MAHGEAVARGLRFALILSAQTGRLPAASFKDLDSLIGGAEAASPDEPAPGLQNVLSLVSRDKKARGARNRFILLRAPGRLEAAENIEPALLKRAFDGALK